MGESIYYILEDKKGNLWFSGKGVSCFDGESFIAYTTDQGLSSNDINTIHEDEKGILWFATWGRGVCSWDGKSFSSIGEKEGLSNNYIYPVCEDNNGNLWFGTMGGGVNCYLGGLFKYFNKNYGLSNNRVRAVTEDKSGKLWFGTSTDVGYFDGENICYFAKDHNLISTWYSSIYEDSQEHIWFGNLNGVTYYDGNIFKYFTTEQGLISNNVNGVIQDKNGIIWISTWGSGVSSYDGTSFSNYTTEHGLVHNSIITFFEDKKGNLWFGTEGGVSCFDGNNFLNYTTEQGLKSNSIRSIMEDQNGNIWLGLTDGGLSCYNGTSFKHYTTKQGLNHHIVRSIIEDKNKNIWIGTDNGINYLLASTSPNMTPDLYNYTSLDGFKYLALNNNAVYCDSKNQIWWGGYKGITKMDLNNFKLPKSIPSIQLNSIEIQQNFVDYRLLKEAVSTNKSNNPLPKVYYEELVFDSVASFYNYPLNFELPYKLNHLTFHFSAIDWAAPHKLKYQYKIDGLDKQWSQLSSENKADYRNIPYGEYTFTVRAVGAAKKWSDTFEYSFIINPPWWHTWWARVIYAIMVVMLMYGIVKWRTAKLKQEKKKLEKKVDLATKEIRGKNEDLRQQNEEISTINNALSEQKEFVEVQKEVVEEKNSELSKQNEEINAQKEELTVQRDQLSDQNKSIAESILYAKRIQTAVLPSHAYIDVILPENFIFFKPRDKVSGDFYWVKHINSYIVITAADCTGHGVPGAILSMLGMSFLNEIVQKREITQANQVLNELRKQIKQALRQTGKKGETDDGMDMALCALDTKTNILQYAGANNPLYLIQNGELNEIKADKMPIGYYPNEKPEFTNHEIQLKSNDIFYLFSDGFMDQFGGKKGFKYKASNFQKILLENHNKPMAIQKEMLEDELKNWMKGYEQTDDILVMGVRI